MVSKLARSACGFGFLSMLVVAAAGQAAAQEVTIEWEIANRFRLFAEQIDFDMQVRTFRAISGKTVLETEQKLADQSRGNGWAAGVHRLCYDSSTGQVPARCRRDGVEESYLSPKDLRIRLAVKLPADFGNAKCTWTIGAGEEAKTVPDRDCRNVVNDPLAPHTQDARAPAAGPSGRGGGRAGQHPGRAAGRPDRRAWRFARLGRRQPDQAGRPQRQRLLLPPRAAARPRPVLPAWARPRQRRRRLPAAGRESRPAGRMGGRQRPMAVRA